MSTNVERIGMVVLALSLLTVWCGFMMLHYGEMSRSLGAAYPYVLIGGAALIGGIGGLLVYCVYRF